MRSREHSIACLSTGLSDGSSAIRVLMVDDDEDEYVLTNELLSEVHHFSVKLEWTGSYSQALELMVVNSHDVYFVDYRLGEQYGTELLEQAIQGGCHAPIIILTGSDDGELDARAMSLGAADYLVKGQFDSVLVERAIRYAIERKRLEMEREELNRQLVDTSRRVGVEDATSSILHNVGNVLNSVNVSVSLVVDIFRQSLVEDVGQVADMLQAHAADLNGYIHDDPKGRQVLPYLAQLSQHISEGKSAALKELNALTTNLDHMKQIIAAHESSGKTYGLQESVVLFEIMDQALAMNKTGLDRANVTLIRQYEDVPQVLLEKAILLQILVNLVRNAKHAMLALPKAKHQLTLGIKLCEDREGFIRLQIGDTGAGIPHEHLTRIFAQGYSTKPMGQGLGLHSSALNAKVLGGALRAWSDGEGQGSLFTLDIPVVQTEAD